MACEDAPDLAGILQLRLPKLQVFERDPLAIQHPIDVVIGLDKQFCRVWKGFVLRKPGSLRMPMRADDRQAANLGVECLGNFEGYGLGGK